MYNLTTFIAIVQQAIKKPLVTELLPRSSYTWGWRCERNYVQFLDIGQVTFITCSIAIIIQDGDRRWFLSKPIPPCKLILQDSALQKWGISLPVLFRQKRWLPAGMAARCDKNEESQVLAVPGFH